MDNFDSWMFYIFAIIITFLIFAMFRYLTGSTVRRWKNHKAEIVGQWEAEGLEFVLGPSGGQFGGLESKGEHQPTRGAGLAALTDKDIRLTTLTPFSTWIVPYAQIESVWLQSSFLGKPAKKTPYIVVEFQKNNQTDRLAFQVIKAEEWLDKLGELAGLEDDDLEGDVDNNDETGEDDDDNNVSA